MKSQHPYKPSIKLNFVLNFLRVFSAAIVGVITMPYLNRVLGAEYIGKVEYVYTIINYFVLFSALGIPMYGIREISKNREDKERLYSIVIELIIILLFTTLISYIIIFGVVIRLDFFAGYRELIILMSGMIFLSNMGLEWYFQGIENQTFITIRSIVIRSFTIIFIFLFVKLQTDYKIYAFLLAVFSFLANIFNLGYVGFKVYRFKKTLKGLDFKRHFKPILTIFIATISINIYVQLDNFLIGILCGDKYVGYYSIANKLIRNSIILITIIGSVMLPRLSYLYANDNLGYNVLLKKSLDVLLLIACPFSIYFFIFSEDIIYVMGGQSFNPAILTMRILSPLCIIVSIAYFYGFLILYPQNKEKIYTRATVYTAIFSVIINFFVVKYYQHNGAAVTALLSEIFAILIMFFSMKKHKLTYNFLDANFFKIILINAILFILSGLILYFLNSKFSLYYFLIYSVLFFFSYAMILLIAREKNTVEIFKQFVLSYIKKN